jgi:serine/threonine protein kinase
VHDDSTVNRPIAINHMRILYPRTRFSTNLLYTPSIDGFAAVDQYAEFQCFFFRLLLMQVTRAVKKELYLMKELAHDNINRFIGACIDPGHLCIVTQYCSRGSLRVSGNSVMYGSSHIKGFCDVDISVTGPSCEYRSGL